MLSRFKGFCSCKSRIVIVSLLLGFYFLLAVGIYGQLSITGRFGQVDFNTYYAAANLWLRGENIYDGGLTEAFLNEKNLEYISDSNYIYPPYFAVIFSFFALAPPLLLGLIWFILGLFCLGFTCLIIITSRLSKSEKKIFAIWQDCFILSLIFIPTAYSLYVGQVNLVLLFLVAYSFYCLKKNRDVLAGILLGIAILIKVSPIILLFYLITQKRKRAFVLAISTIAIVLIITLPYLKDEVYIFVTDVIPKMSSPVPNPINQSINGFFSRIFYENVFSKNLLNCLPAVRLSTLIISAILIFFTIFIACRLIYKNSQDELGILCLFIILMVIVSPLAWENYFVLLLLPIINLYLERDYLTSKQRYALLLALFLITIQRLWDPYVNSPEKYSSLRNFTLLMSLDLYSAFVIFFLQISLLRRKLNSDVSNNGNRSHLLFLRR